VGHGWSDGRGLAECMGMNQGKIKRVVNVFTFEWNASMVNLDVFTWLFEGVFFFKGYLTMKILCKSTNIAL